MDTPQKLNLFQDYYDQYYNNSESNTLLQMKMEYTITCNECSENDYFFSHNNLDDINNENIVYEYVQYV